MTIDIFVLVLFIVACVRIAVLTRRLAAVTDRSWRTIAGLQRELARTDSVMEIERDRLCKMLGIPHYYALPARVAALLEIERKSAIPIGTLIAAKSDGTATVRLDDTPGLNEYEDDGGEWDFDSEDDDS